MGETLRISVRFPNGAYSGSDLGMPEDLPGPARLHEALVAAAAGGPGAERDGRLLVAPERHRAALAWLEENPPEGIVAPEVALNRRRATRYRRRAAPLTLNDTGFEPSASLSGSIDYYWPAAPEGVAEAIGELASEVTHVGRADSVAVVSAGPGGPVPEGPGVLRISPGRGPGRVMRLPLPGRLEALAEAHRSSSSPGGHAVGNLGRQAKDVHVTGANVGATDLVRFAPAGVSPEAWPFDEVWELRGDLRGSGGPPASDPSNRVAIAVAVHRAIVRLIGEDVPPFVSGRDGDGPLRGAGHLAIQVAEVPGAEGFSIWLGVPTGVGDGDRTVLREAITRPIFAGFRRGSRKVAFSASSPRLCSALPFWSTTGERFRTAVPMVLDAPGTPRRGPWTFADAVVCSVGYALRGVLERRGLEWGRGWAFRRELVRILREDYGVGAAARRVHGNAGRYLHRAYEGDLLVAAEAVVDLGELAPLPGGFLALGRGRHLGGGLLVPVSEGGDDGIG